MSVFDKFRLLLSSVGENSKLLDDQNTAYIAVDGQVLLSKQSIPGVNIEIEQQTDLTIARITITSHTQVPNPVHLCFSMFQQIGRQNFRVHIILEPYAKVSFISHGLFTTVDIAKHIMGKTIEIGEGASLSFTDSHFHSQSGGIKVLSSARIKVGKQGYYFSDFSLTTGHVGKLNLDYSVEAEEHAVVELTSRIFGHANDVINMTEKVSLNGRFSHSVIKSRVALEGEAIAVITGITEGCAEGARGHMDCLEIIKDKAVGQSIPVVKVSHPLAKVTHEAAIGTIDNKQLETLIVHGLSPEQATDLIVLGILR